MRSTTALRRECSRVADCLHPTRAGLIARVGSIRSTRFPGLTGMTPPILKPPTFCRPLARHRSQSETCWNTYLKEETPMTKVVVHADSAYQQAKVDPRLWSAFTEHLGRCIYGGLYEPGHPSGSSPVEWCNRFVSFGLGYALSWSGVSSCWVGCGVSRDLVRMSRLR